MTAHEQLRSFESVSPGSDRSFGLIVGGILTVIGVYQNFRESDLFWFFVVPGVVLIVLALVKPASLHSANQAWTRLGIVLGKVVTPIVMFLVYALSIVPTGLILRVFGKNLLQLKRNEATDSYWIVRDPPGPLPESFREQF